MAQKQYVEKPFKVMAEQFFAATQPPAAGVCVEVHVPGIVATPHVHCVDGLRDCQESDWILASKFTAATFLDVITDAEFQERFGSPPEVTALPRLEGDRNDKP